jgi:hypothetical protein
MSGEHAHGAEIIVEIGRIVVVDQEDNAGAKRGRSDADRLIEVAPGEIGQVEIAEDEIERGLRGDPGEGKRAAARDNNIVVAKRAREAVQEMPRVGDDEDPWDSDGRRSS